MSRTAVPRIKRTKTVHQRVPSRQEQVIDASHPHVVVDAICEYQRDLARRKYAEAKEVMLSKLEHTYDFELNVDHVIKEKRKRQERIRNR